MASLTGENKEKNGNHDQLRTDAEQVVHFPVVTSRGVGIGIGIGIR